MNVKQVALFIRLAFGLIVGVVGGTLLWKSAQVTEWQQFSSAAGGFSVTFPGEPYESTTTVNTPVGRIESHDFMVQGEDIAYGVSYGDYPQEFVQSTTPDHMLDGARDGMVQVVLGELLYETVIYVDEYPGREVKIRLFGGEGVMLFRFLLAGDSLYSWGVTGAPRKTATQGVTAFMDSFQLLKS